MSRNGGVRGRTTTVTGGSGSGVWSINEAYQLTIQAQWKLLPGFSASSPLSSPTEAAGFGLPAGDYFFKAPSMSSTIQMSYRPNYYDESGFVRVFSSPTSSAATINFMGQNIPYTKLMVQRNTEDLRGVVRFSAQQTYAETSSSGVGGSSGINNFGQTPGTRVILGTAGGHGIYNTSQTSCNWQNSTGAIGAGYNGSNCGAYPNNLAWGTGSGGPTYGNISGTWEHWVTW